MPTIDLLSVLISFLLITAVWVQLARIDTDNVVSKASDRPKQSAAESKPLKILLTNEGLLVRFHGQPSTLVPMGDGLLDRFKTVLTEFKKKAAKDQKVIVAAKDDVVYSLLIEAMDVCLELGLTGLSVADPSTFGS
ncbi:MAG: biopolymer transporter ExbD [Deltaproteobacteria bacterium]|nr:biopolymer transporter ExbD [Deltaproteobacteria bacterium]